MKIYLKYIRMVVRTIMQYRLSFWLITAAQFFVAFFAFAGIFFLFDRFGSVGGWSFAEAALCFGVTHVCFSVTECIARGFDMFSRLVAMGDFDRILLRPRSTLLQVMGTGFEITRIGNLLQGVLVLIFAVSLLDVQWGVLKILTLVFMITGGTFIFTGIFIISAAACFFTIQSMEFINIFSNGGQELASYPMTIYAKPVIRFFTFIIPFGCINYLPLMYVTGRFDAHPFLYTVTPLAGILFIVPCLIIWRFGVRHYSSTGS